MPIVRKGHNFACGNCKRKIKYGEEYYTNDGDIFGYCFNCFVNPSGSEPTEPAEVAPRSHHVPRIEMRGMTLQVHAR